jgi:excisionase family DNA binding protein
METPTKLAYTVKEAASKLSLSRSFLYELIHAGKIETVKIGRSRRITLAQLTEFLTRSTDA